MVVIGENRRFRSISIVLALSSLVLLVAPSSMGFSPGLDGGLNGGSAGSGCLCHGTQDSGVTPSLTVVGNTTPLQVGETYTLEISISGGPAAGGDNAGGFLLDVDSGSLAGSDMVLVEGKEATHSAAGNDQRTWTVDWTADSSDSAEFTLRVNSVNGDSEATDDDDWNMATFYLNSDGTVSETLIQPEARLDVPDWTMNAIIAASVLLMLIMLLIGNQKRPRGRRGEL